MEIGDDWARIGPTSALDFGGIGKGYLLDELGDWLRGEGINDFWLSLGGDILCSGHDVGTQPWRIGIQHALQPRVAVSDVSNDGGALLAVATSGVTKRGGENERGAWHHLIDPRIGAPAVTDVLTASACAPNAVTTDVLAKCLVIVGTAGARHVMRQLHADNALLQVREPNGAVHVNIIGDIWSK